jgi:ubiquinone/menaquinone biosynthesis C-methylase UbiE
MDGSVFEELTLEMASHFMTAALPLERPVAVLELAAGAGALTAQLVGCAPAGSSIVACDASAANLAAVRAAVGPELGLRAGDGVSVDTAQADVGDLSALPAASFDIVIGCRVVLSPAALAECARVLRPG